jgi:hypothetical protein
MQIAQRSSYLFTSIFLDQRGNTFSLKRDTAVISYTWKRQRVKVDTQTSEIVICDRTTEHSLQAKQNMRETSFSTVNRHNKQNREASDPHNHTAARQY